MIEERTYRETEITDEGISVIEITEFENNGQPWVNIYNGKGEGIDIPARSLGLLEKGLHKLHCIAQPKISAYANS